MAALLQYVQILTYDQVRCDLERFCALPLGLLNNLQYDFLAVSYFDGLLCCRLEPALPFGVAPVFFDMGLRYLGIEGLKNLGIGESRD